MNRQVGFQGSGFLGFSGIRVSGFDCSGFMVCRFWGSSVYLLAPFPFLGGFGFYRVEVCFFFVEEEKLLIGGEGFRV